MRCPPRWRPRRDVDQIISSHQVRDPALQPEQLGKFGRQRISGVRDTKELSSEAKRVNRERCVDETSPLPRAEDEPLEISVKQLKNKTQVS